MVSLCKGILGIFRLWGENFFNPKTKKWAKRKEDDNKRSFCMYVLDPIYKASCKLFCIEFLTIAYDEYSYRPILI